MLDNITSALLVGYESFTSNGFALPIYKSMVGANQAFVAEVDAENNIIQFNVYEGKKSKPTMSQPQNVALGSPFMYVFIFEENEFIGTKAQIWGEIERKFETLKNLLPLTLLDFKNEMKKAQFQEAVLNAYNWRHHKAKPIVNLATNLANGISSDSERRALAFTGSGDFIWDWDVNSDYIYISPEIEPYLGLKKGQASGSSAHFLGLVKAEDRDKIRLDLDTLLENRKGRLHLEFRTITPNNDTLWMLLRASPVIGAEGKVMRVTGTIYDNTESKTSEERLTNDAVRDSLTALPSRVLFMDRLETVLTLAKTNENIRPTVIVLYLDNFSKVNEAIGHNAADTLLLTLSRRLSRMLKPIDSLARVDSDKFAMIILSEFDPPRITSLTDLMRRALRAPIPFGDKEIFLTGSIGMALINTNHNKAEDILKDAEFAAFHAKRLGGDRIQVFKPSMRAQRSDRLIHESDLRSALETQTIKLNYLPIVRLSDRTLAGFEVVPRWDHPVYGRLPFTEYMPHAEESGLILDLGLYLLEYSSAQLNYWQREVPTQPPISINLNFSSNKLLRNDILPDIASILKRHPVIPNTLKLELSESYVMENPEYAAIMLTKLKQMRLGTVLTDFGKGNSSFNFIQRLALDQIKIHSSLISAIDGKKRSPLVRSILTMTHDLGLSALISGVENESDITYTSQLGCEYAQGSVFGDSLTPEEVNHFLMKKQG